MAADIDQLDAIIDKFLDYARPDHAEAVKPVSLDDVIEACTYAVRDRPTCASTLDVPPDIVYWPTRSSCVA
jgi:two-component system osmolarity sensor histidine kinase EnvZ